MLKSQRARSPPRKECPSPHSSCTGPSLIARFWAFCLKNFISRAIECETFCFMTWQNKCKKRLALNLTVLGSKRCLVHHLGKLGKCLPVQVSLRQVFPNISWFSGSESSWDECRMLQHSCSIQLALL